MWKYFVTTAYFVVLAVAAQFTVGFGLALLLNREFKGKGTVTTLMLIPMMLSPVVVGLFWRFILDSSWGLMNYLLSLIPGTPGSTRNIIWLTRPKMALFSLVVIDTWMWSPFMMLLSLAGLSAIPKYLYEAAEIDGANRIRKLLHVTIPLLSPTTFYCFIISIINGFKVFDQIYLMTGGMQQGGGPDGSTMVLVFKIYRDAFSSYQMGYASAESVILLLIVLVVTIMQYQGQTKWVTYET